jgi:branched-chain amino acid aminotransferase
MQVWLNGQILPQQAARIPVLDHGFTVGDGVFETLKVVAGKPFAQTRHIARLRRSAGALGLPEPDADTVAQAISEVIEANRGDMGDLGRLRITFTSGEGPSGSDRGSGPPTMVAVASPAAPWPASTEVVTAPWPRNERSPLAGVKSTSYAENAVALAYAKTRGASEAIMGNTRGELCEGTGSNVFLLLGGKWVTHSLDSGCLAGITRALVCKWFGIAEEAVPLASLAEAEEVFITSSTRDIQPVHRVDAGVQLSTEEGARLAAEFARRAAADVDP